MFRVLGNSKKLCQGMSRRDLLRVGGLGMAGLSLPQILQLQELAAADNKPRTSSFGKAKSVILLHLYGSPSQLEWADPKESAPVEIRGELKHIQSSLPGCGVCELLPNFAKVMDRTTVLRSMTHPYPIHGVAYALTGIPIIDVAMELRPNDSRHWPFFGSAVEFIESQKRKTPPPIPHNIALPWRFSSHRKGEVPRSGPYAAFLGHQYDPVWTEFVGKATKGRTKVLNDMTYSDNDPYMGCSPDAHFRVPAAASLPKEVTLDRLKSRKSLLQQFNHQRADLLNSAEGQRLSRHQETALALLKSQKLGKALDVRLESAQTRELYGHTLFGQSCLAARRLVEEGSRVVSVFWDEYGLAGTGWDTHWNHYPRLKQELCPGFDMAYYGLITDLDRRGMLDDTLVVCTSEHGRTPKFNKISGNGRTPGRDHWSRCYTSLMAGGGTARGHIVGASDKIGGDVADRPISPKDLLATMYHLLGIDPHTTIHDRGQRPLPLVPGEVITEALA